jgi:carboxyl-terminal processing protease
VQEADLAARPPRNGPNRIAVATKAILGRLYGSPETAVSIAYADEGGNRRETKIARARRRGTSVGPGGILYLAVELDARRLDSGFGYIRLNTFQPPLVSLVSSAIKSMGSVRGLVFDVRGNSGGEIEGMPGLFLGERTLLFLSRSRSGETAVFVDPAADVYRGPLVLLVDQLSGSASELFAGCLQAIGRAAVVGERSPGAVVESDMMVLRNGAIFMYPVAQLATPDGTVLEGRGVVPDIEVGLDRALLLQGVDSQLQAAIRHLEKETPR